MPRTLVPVGGTRNDRFAVQAVVRRFMNDAAMDVHRLNVQAPFLADIAYFSSPESRHGFQRDKAEQALAPARQTLDRFSIPYAVPMEVGDRAKLITEAARRLPCDEIVMATARKNSLTSLVGSSVTDKAIELTPVPVEVIAGDSMSNWGRHSTPVAIGVGVVVFVAMPVATGD